MRIAARIAVFTFTFAIGAISALILTGYPSNEAQELRPVLKLDTAKGTDQSLFVESLPPGKSTTSPLKVLSKKKAVFTDEARSNGIQGNVTLRVTFLASGKIGGITTVKGLPYGLTETAIAAAREIKFEPEMVNGIPRTTSRPVTFSFNIY